MNPEVSASIHIFEPGDIEVRAIEPSHYADRTVFAITVGTPTVGRFYIHGDTVLSELIKELTVARGH